MAWQCWLDKGGYDGDLNREAVIGKAEPLLQKALQLNPDLAPAHLFKAFMELWYHWDFEAADKEYKKVLELNPSNKLYIVTFSDFLNATGRHQEALHNTLDAFKNDKNSEPNWATLAENYYYNNELAKADEMINAAASLFSDDNMQWYYLKIKIYLEKYNDVITSFEKTDSTINPSLYPTKLAYIAIAYYKTGQKDKTQKALEILKAKSLASPIGSPCFCIAAIYTAMGQNNEAIKWLEKAYTDHEVEMYWLKVEPMFKSLHNDRRFGEILKKIGFK